MTRGPQWAWDGLFGLAIYTAILFPVFVMIPHGYVTSSVVLYVLYLIVAIFLGVLFASPTGRIPWKRTDR